MAVVIRLQRTGKPHQPYYRVVAIEKARAASGKPVEILGSYDPRQPAAGKKVVLKKERYAHWIKVGALPGRLNHINDLTITPAGDVIVSDPLMMKSELDVSNTAELLTSVIFTRTKEPIASGTVQA